MKNIISIYLIFTFLLQFSLAQIVDDFVNESLNNVEVVEKTPVIVRISNDFTTKLKKAEGEEIQFVTVNDVKINNKLYPKGSIVDARIETVSMNKAFGVPADLTVGNFKLGNTRLAGEINKTGANRAYWVWPIGGICLLGLGLGVFILAVRGGHAKIKTSEKYTFYIR